MNKGKALLYAGLLGIIVGGVPYFMGQLVETKFKDVVALAPDLNPAISTQVLEYQRGWWRSYAKTRITLKNATALQKYLPGQDQSQSPLSFSVVLEHDIHHGPFVRVKEGSYRDWAFARALIHSKLFLTDKAKEIIKAEIGESHLFDLHSEIKMDGAVKFTLEGKPINYKKAAESAKWQGLQGLWELSADLKHFQGHLLCPSLDYAWPEGDLVLQDLVLKTDYLKTTEGIWVGKGGLDVKNFKFDQKAGNLSLVGQDFVAGGAVDLHDNLVDSRFDFQMEKLVKGGETYGPIVFTASLKNLQSSVYKNILQLARDTDNLDNQGLLVQKLMPLLPEIIKTRPQFNIDNFQIRTAQGDITGMFTIALGGEDVSNAGDFNQLINSIAAKAALVMPKTIFRSMVSENMGYPKLSQPNTLDPSQPAAVDPRLNPDALIAGWVAQQLLIEKNQMYVIQVELLNGRVLVNGKEMAFPVKSQGGLAPVQPGLPVN